MKPPAPTVRTEQRRNPLNPRRTQHRATDGTRHSPWVDNITDAEWARDNFERELG